MNTLTLLALAFSAAVAVIALAVVLRAWGRGRAARRRISALVARIGGEAELTSVERARTLEGALDRLERSIDVDRGRIADADAERRRLEQALQNVDLGVVIADDAGHVVFANPFARRYLGGRQVDAIVDHRIREMTQAVLDGEPGGTDELDLIGPPRRVLRLRTAPLDDGARAIGALCIIVDATSAARTDAVRRDFVANISHELKTPVGALGLLAETLSETLDEPEVAQRLAGRLVHETQRLVRIIDDLLALSRLEAEEAPRREAVSIDLVVAEAAERVRAGYVRTNVEIVTDIPAGATVAADRRQLATALYNLIENAVKYSEPDSVVRVEATLTAAETRITVRDRGLGIPPHELPRIFERFYRVDRARSRATGGTGLGLSIVRHVAAAHGGSIDVQSTLGQGSTFTLVLPRSERDLPTGPTSEQLDLALDLTNAGGSTETSGHALPHGTDDGTPLARTSG